MGGTFTTPWSRHGLILAALLAATGIAGCGAKSESIASCPPSAADAAPEAAPEPLEPRSLSRESSLLGEVDSPPSLRLSSKARAASPSVSRQPEPPVTSGELVEVYFATDRLPTAELLPSSLRTFAPVGIVWMICATLFIGFSLAKRFKALWLVGCGLSVCLGITVFHATIIRWQQYARLASNSETRFSALRDDEAGDYPLHLGSARVSLPASHKPGRFEQPQLIHFEFVESPEKHIVLYNLTVEDSSSAWFDELSLAAQDSPMRDGFVFIHGYNVRFIDALKRTAQLASDLELKGPAICYSWPSRGNVAAYSADEAAVSWSAPHFEQLLLDLKSRTQCQRLHVIAHSMGNRALLQAIERISLHQPANSPEPPKLIDSLVMAAPDVDLAVFSSRYVQPLEKVSGRTTLYFSDSDRALLLSAGIHGAPRLGLLRDHLQAFTGIDSIYVGSQSSLSLGHAYYADDPAVIEDLKHLLQDGQSAGNRKLLRSATNSAGVSFWKLQQSLHR